MPEIARFFGIIIKMYFSSREHNPPHFHVVYGEHTGLLDINTLEMIEGDLTPRVLGLVREWAQMHQAELIQIWNTQKIEKLPPLV